MNKAPFSKIIIPLTSILFVFLFIKTVDAADFLVSWKTQSFVPSDYPGKIFPIKNSPIEISFDLIDNGKLANISKNEIRWLLDGKLLKSGLGIKTANFTTSKNGGGDHLVKIIITDFKGEKIDYTATIPVVNPEIIIDLRHPNNLISFGENSFQALPYFFNVQKTSDLNFEWSVNNQKTDGDSSMPNFLGLRLNSQDNKETSINLSVFAQNPLNQMELASKLINLIAQ